MPAVPNALGNLPRAEAVISALANLQREELELDLRKTATSAKETDTFAVRGDNEVTFKEERQRLARAQRTVMDENRDILPRVRKEIERRAAAEEAQDT
jgi:hypothetical protein